MAGTIIVSSIKTDTDNSFIVRSNTGATLFSVDTTSISIPDGSITSAMIANGTVIAADILDGTITDAKIAAVANTKITGLITSGQIATVANTQITGLITSGQIATVANTQITGNITQAQIATGVAGTGPAFSAYKNSSVSSNQSISSAVFTKVTFDTENFDTNNNFASSTFTPTVAGYYQINAGLSAEISGSITRVLISTYKNGVEYNRGIDLLTGGYSVSVCDVIYCNGSTDYIEVYVYATGTSLVVRAQPYNLTYFSGVLVRGA
jgi:hypothetical protein